MRSLQEHLVVPVDDTRQRREQLVFAPSEYKQLVPYAFSYLRLALYCLLVIATFGILLIFSVWFPQIFTSIARQKLSQVDLHKADYVLIQVYGDGCWNAKWIEIRVHRSAQTTSTSDQLAAPESDPSVLPWSSFTFKQHRYVFNHDTQTFDRYLATTQEEFDLIQRRTTTGLDSYTAAERLQMYGLNRVDVDPPSVLKLVFTKLVHPYYLFQVFSVVVWLHEDYEIYASVILSLSAISLGWEIYTEVANTHRLRALVRSDERVDVLRTGVESDGKKITTLHETELVPGDIVQLSEGAVVADMLLLSGGCVVDEASLTGEAVPINKEPVRGQDATITDATARTQFKASFLHAGSIITRVREGPGVSCRAVVVNTGFSTGKGELFRSILFPRPLVFEFERDAYRCLMVLVVIALAAFLKRVVESEGEGVTFSDTLINSLDLVTIAVPPALPLVLSIGTGFSLQRLKQQGIFCIDAQRINSCGQVDTLCFDKTGTLTEERLELVGVDVARQGDSSQLHREQPASLSNAVAVAMATCHNVSQIDGVLYGYTLEVSMLEASQATLTATPVASPYLALVELPAPFSATYGILKRFPFDADSQRSSVVIENLKTKQRLVIVKGSIEVIRRVASGAPAEVESKSLRYAGDGLYCIGFAVREVATTETLDLDKREQVECDLKFLGIALFDNPVKPESSQMLSELYAAEMDVRMITGDSALTAVHVARLVGMPLTRSVAVLDVDDGGNVVVHYSSVGGVEQQQWQSIDVTSVEQLLSEYELAVTGRAIDQLQQHLSDESLRAVLLHAQIFARIRPTQKAWLVERLMDYGRTVGMCGDGTNDCGALKAAHAGLALSSTEASIIAPFTSKSKALSDVVTLLREGRCALSTSFLAFKYMVLYPVIQLGEASAMSELGFILTSNQAVWDDIAIVLGLAIAMLHTTAATRLGKERPPRTLFSASIVLSILGQITLFIVSFATVWVMLMNQPWFCSRGDGEEIALAFVTDPNSVNATTFDATVLDNCLFYTEYAVDPVEDIEVAQEGTASWLYVHLVYITVALAFNLRDPFRRAFYTNVGFVVLVIATLGVNLWLLMDDGGAMNETFQLVALSSDYRVLMLIVFVCHLVCSFAWELVATWLLPTWRRHRKHLSTSSVAGRVATKNEESEKKDFRSTGAVDAVV